MSAVLLLPGMMCDARLWTHQVTALCAAGHTVTIPNLSRGVTVQEMAAAILATAPPSFALAGLSMGGILAFEIWRQAQRRVERLALLDTTPHAELEHRRRLRNGEIERAMHGGLLALIEDELKPRYLASRNRHDLALRAQITSMAMNLGAVVFRNQALALRDRPDSTPMLSGIDVPTLVLCGREDDLCPLGVHLLLAESIPTADLVILSDCGHLPPLERPLMVSQCLLTWLSRT